MRVLRFIGTRLQGGGWAYLAEIVGPAYHHAYYQPPRVKPNKWQGRLL